MALFPQFPYANLHELNLDWLIENISQIVEDGTVISVNGMSGRVTLYTEKDVELPPRAFDANWSVYRRIADKMAGIQFTGEKFFYITKNVGDEDFTIQEVFTSANPPPYPVTSVNGRIGTVIIAGDNTPYNMDGVDTIEDVVSNIQKAIGPVVQYTSCSVGVTAGQYVYLFMSGISGRTDGIYKAANNKAANTTWTSADLIPVTAGIGGLIDDINTNLNPVKTSPTITSDIDIIDWNFGYYSISQQAALDAGYIPEKYGNIVVNKPNGLYESFLFFGTASGKVYYRVAHQTNKTWYHPWQELTTIPTYEIPGDGCRVYKSGNVCMLNIDAYTFTSDGTNLLDRNGNQVTIPLNYRPSVNVRGYDTNRNHQIRVDTNGNVTSTDTFTDEGIRVTMTWI